MTFFDCTNDKPPFLFKINRAKSIYPKVTCCKIIKENTQNNTKYPNTKY